MKKLLLLFIAVLVPSLFIAGCSGTDDLLTTTENVDVTLDSFQLTYSPPAGSAEKIEVAKAAAATVDNPSCGTVNLNDLLADNPDWEDIADRIKKVEIDKVRYKVTNNLTAVPITGKLMLTDPVSSELTTVAEVSIAANANVEEWTELPFVGNGKDTVNHYLSNRGVTFEYCAEGSPNDESLSLTLGIELGLDVVVKILYLMKFTHEGHIIICNTM